MAEDGRLFLESELHCQGSGAKSKTRRSEGRAGTSSTWSLATSESKQGTCACCGHQPASELLDESLLASCLLLLASCQKKLAYCFLLHPRSSSLSPFYVDGSRNPAVRRISIVSEALLLGASSWRAVGGTKKKKKKVGTRTESKREKRDCLVDIPS